MRRASASNAQDRGLPAGQQGHAEADEELFFVIDEKQNQVELTEGIALTANMEDDHFSPRPMPGTLVAIDGSDDSMR